MPDSTELRAVWLGRVPYQEALVLQRALLTQRQQDECPDTLLLLEHPHVITLGRRGVASDVLASANELAKSGVDVVETDRGGQTTFHGPGQLVAYGIIDLRAAGLGPVSYVRRLELAAIETLSRWGIRAHRVEGKTGVWVGGEDTHPEAKIAAIGVKVSRGVTMHGLALNVSTDLTFFDRIVPCGMPGVPAASIGSLCGVHISTGEVGFDFAEKLGRQIGRRVQRVSTSAVAV